MADASVDPDRPGDWTHALMDIGATLCRPRVPRYDECPLRPWCRFAAETAETAASGPTFDRAHRRPVHPRPASRAPAIRFATTTRWLRGRIVDRLRDASGTDWSKVAAPIGDHDRAAVRAALGALAHDGLVELDPTDPDRARLATA
jgi:adenine-specific DNA glycosylase